MYNKLEGESQFFTKLEKSVLSEGIINPVLCYSVKSGTYPVYGANRVYYAKIHELDIPCIIIDYTGQYDSLEELRTERDILDKYTDTPDIVINEDYVHIQGCRHYHL